MATGSRRRCPIGSEQSAAGTVGEPAPGAQARYPEPETHGDQVRAGVARATLLNALLREPAVIAALDGLATSEIKPDALSTDRGSDCVAAVLAEALAEAERHRAARLAGRDRMAALTGELGLGWLGPWLPEYLEAALHFRRALAAADLASCFIADPRLRAARAYVRTWYADGLRFPWRGTSPGLRLLAAVLPASEPPEWDERTPDWIQLYTILIEHAAERLDWTVETTGTDRLWPFLLSSAFVADLTPDDDPEVLHGLIGLWAVRSAATIDTYTRPRLPRGRVPGMSVVDPDGRLSAEGGRDKLRRWVSWYVDKEVRHVRFNDLLRTAFETSDDPLGRSSEVNRHIREAKRCLALELPLDAGQALRLWQLGQAFRGLLEQLLPDGGEIS